MHYFNVLSGDSSLSPAALMRCCLVLGLAQSAVWQCYPVLSMLHLFQLIFKLLSFFGFGDTTGLLLAMCSGDQPWWSLGKLLGVRKEPKLAACKAKPTLFYHYSPRKNPLSQSHFLVLQVLSCHVYSGSPGLQLLAPDYTGYKAQELSEYEPRQQVLTPGLHPSPFPPPLKSLSSLLLL